MSNYGIIEENIDEVRQLIEGGMSAYKVAQRIGCACGSLCKALKKHGIKLKTRSKADPKNLLKDKTDKVIGLYESGYSTYDIGLEVGHSQSQIWGLLNKYGKLVDRRYSVDETFFENVDTQEKAYILGWFYSDGNVRMDGKIRIQIQEEDSYILDRIAKIMKYSGPLHDVPPPKKFPHRKSQKVLDIGRKTLASQLIRLGCQPNKSLILRFPDSNMVPEYLLRHFVRGYFDGDGSARLRNRNLGISFTSTDIFLNELDRQVLTPMGIESKMYYRRKGKNSATLFINKQKYIKPMFQYMYQDSTIHLDRKFQKFQTVL
jgi:intein/homing endonuclease